MESKTIVIIPIAKKLVTLFSLIVMLLSFSFSIQAGVPETYPTIRSLMGVPMYRLTCSNMNEPVHTHFYAEINEGWVRSLKILLIAPAESVHVIEVAAGDLSGFVASLGFTHLEIKGDWTGAFFNQRLFLNVWDGQDGMVGHLEYDDGDGFETSLDMICGAVNYVRTK